MFCQMGGCDPKDLLFGRNFAENCMQIKEIRLRIGAHVFSTSLSDLPMQYVGFSRIVFELHDTLVNFSVNDLRL